MHLTKSNHNVTTPTAVLVKKQGRDRNEKESNEMKRKKWKGRHSDRLLLCFVC